MRFSLVDLAFAIASIAIGLVMGRLLAFHLRLPPYLRLTVVLLGGPCVYLAFIYPFYRGLRLAPMLLPRCPCCQNFQHGFYVDACGWPRVSFRCPSCNGEFVIRLNGQPSDQETWERPVLALKWPYALGVYKRMLKPEPDGTPERYHQ